MRLTRFIALSVFVAAATGAIGVPYAHAEEGVAPFRVVGYVPTWTTQDVSERALGQLSDLIIFSAEVTADGDFPAQPIPDETLAWYQRARDEHHLRLHLCIGGWGRSAGFSDMTGNAVKRTAFIEKALEYCKRHGIHGIDYDWEFPGNQEEKSAYDALIMETSFAARSAGVEVSIALGWTQTISEAAQKAVNHVHLMTYDMGKRHADFGDMESVVKRLLSQGTPAAKICLGVPFYGRKLDDPEVSADYANLVRDFKVVSETDSAGGYTFNGPETIRRKTRYAIEKGLGGIMIWQVSGDATGDLSLLEAITAVRLSP